MLTRRELLKAFACTCVLSLVPVRLRAAPVTYTVEYNRSINGGDWEHIITSVQGTQAGLTLDLDEEVSRVARPGDKVVIGGILVWHPADLGQRVSEYTPPLPSDYWQRYWQRDGRAPHVWSEEDWS